MKPLQTKRMVLAGYLASGFTILGGLVMSLVVVLLFSDSARRDTSIVAVVFGLILAVLVQTLRRPRDPAEKKRWRWRWPWRRRAKRDGAERRYWKRKRGQSHNEPFGQREVPQPSTFVAAPRKPTEP